MEPKTIRIIAPLPPKGSKAARHAGEVIFHFVQAGHVVRPATTATPAYSPDILPFAPKREYEPMKARLVKERADTFVLYPEGLDFRVISQRFRRHRWLEKWRRLTLVWQLLRHSKMSIVVFRPRLLKRPDHFAMVMLALGIKLFRPNKVLLFRQSRSPRTIVEPIIGTHPEMCTDAEADMASVTLALGDGAKNVRRLTPIWLLSALARINKSDPLYHEISMIESIVKAYGHNNLPVCQVPVGEAFSAPFEDKVEGLTDGVPLSKYMLHLHHARRFRNRFPLGSGRTNQSYLNWYSNEAPSVLGHALPKPTLTNEIDAEITPDALAEALFHILKNVRFFGAASSVSPAIRNWLNTKLTDHQNGLTRLELLIAVMAHAPADDPASIKTPWQNAGLKSWFADLAFGGYPMLAEIAGLSPPDTAPAFLVTGAAGDDTGLGQNRLMSQKALANITPKRDFYLHHVNADEIPSQMLKYHKPGAFHIGFLLWELERLPKAHQYAGELLDEIWVPSRYLQEIYQRAYNRPVTWVGKGFDLPKPQRFDLEKIGISSGQPCFLVSFDLRSSVARKNPLAAVLAFQMAFEGNPDARLIIKTSRPPLHDWGDPERQMSIIDKIIAKDSRIIRIKEHMPFARYLGLIAAVTAVVSPHRAEGFGYVPAYAMSLGTPVIVTDYSGTQDFCTPKTALCVPWRPRNVRRGEPILPVEGANWAEINHEALAKAMLEVVANPEATKTRCEAGKTQMEQKYRSEALRLRYLTRLRDLDLI